MVNRTQGIERCRRQIRHGADDPPEQDDALLVGDRSDGIDELCGRFLSKIAHQERANLIASHKPESARGRHSHRPLKVVQQIAQLRNHNRRGLGEPARVRANQRIIVAQQLQHRAGRQLGTEARGCANGSL